MIRAEKLDLLNQWVCLYLRTRLVYKNLRQMFDAAPECEVISIADDIHEEYTKLVAEKVGDEDNWLDWYLFENDAGEKGFEAKAANWKKGRKIKTLEDLLDLIENKPNNK